MTNSTANKGRLERRFAAVREQNRAALVTFLTAGDPDPETAARILMGMPAAGADIIEIGMPFSDPMADGPAIQLANLRALAAGMTLNKTLETVAAFRQQDDDTPIILMGYYNPIHHMGVQNFIDRAIEAGVDGLIIVDLPPEEDDELCHPCLTAGLNWIRLTTPTSDDKRLATVLKNSSGFVYHVSIAGITGTRSADLSAVSNDVARIRNLTDLPIAVGFGIKTPEQVSETAKIADAVVVGSALVSRIADASDKNKPPEDTCESVHSLVRSLANGLGR